MAQRMGSRVPVLTRQQYLQITENKGLSSSAGQVGKRYPCTEDPSEVTFLHLYVSSIYN